MNKHVKKIGVSCLIIRALCVCCLEDHQLSFCLLGLDSPRFFICVWVSRCQQQIASLVLHTTAKKVKHLEYSITSISWTSW